MQLFYVFILFILLTNINLSFGNSKTPCPYPSSSIKLFNIHTITVFIFSQPQNPSFYYLASPINTKLPSMSAFLLNEQFKHYFDNYIQHNNQNNNINNYDNNDDNDTNDDNQKICIIPPQELEKRDLLYLISQNVSKSYTEIAFESMEQYLLIFSSNLNQIKKEIPSLINDYIKKIEIMYKLIMSNGYTKFEQLYQISIDLWLYPYYTKFEEFLKGIYNLIRMSKDFVIFIESNQCNELIEYLQYILPNYLSIIVIRQICALLIIGIFIIFTILSIFIFVWFWYRNMINQFYLNNTLSL